MAVWTTEAEARFSLRTFLNDGPQDKPVKNKKVFGVVDGVNKVFKTWDDRLLDGTVIVYINDAALLDTEVTLDDPITGQITLWHAPPTNAMVRASYFYQYFLDAECDEGLRLAAGQIEMAPDITAVPTGLGLAALNYAGYILYQKLASRWLERMTSRFLVEESPTENEPVSKSNQFRAAADSYLSRAQQLRDDFYQNQGRRASPAFGRIYQIPPPVGPRR